MQAFQRRNTREDSQRGRSDSNSTLRPSTPHQICWRSQRSNSSIDHANSDSPFHGITQRKILERCLAHIPSERSKESLQLENLDARYFNRVYISKFACKQILGHALSSQQNEVIGMLIGTTVGSTFIVTRTFRVPAVGTETRVNAQAESYEYMIQYMNDVVGNGDNNSETSLDRIVGWYHSHPGYDCWLSGIDMETQDLNQSFQDPYLAIVVDPTTSLERGEICIGAFRTYKKGTNSGGLDFYELPLLVFESELNRQIKDYDVNCVFQQLDEHYELSLIDSLMESMKQYNDLQGICDFSGRGDNPEYNNYGRESRSTSHSLKDKSEVSTELCRGRSLVSLSAALTNTGSDIEIDQDSTYTREGILGSYSGSEGTAGESNMVFTLPEPNLNEHLKYRTFISRNLESLVTGNIIPEMMEEKNTSYHMEMPSSGDDRYPKDGCKSNAKQVALRLQLKRLFSAYTANKRKLLELKKRELEDLKFYMDTFSL